MTELVIRHLVVLALAWVLSLALRRNSAALRHALWSLAMLYCALLPILQRLVITLPAWLLQLFAAQSESPPSEISFEVAELGVFADITASTTSFEIPWILLFSSIYLVVTIVLILRWAVGWRQASRLARNGVVLGSAHGIPVVSVEGVGPLTFGWPNARIIVPHDNYAFDSPVVLHEVAHVQRADFVWQAIARLACSLWWFSPAIWFAARQLRREAEWACDDRVLSHGVSAPDYSGCLLETAAMRSSRLSQSEVLLSAVPKARNRELGERISALLSPGKNRDVAKPLVVTSLALILLPAVLHLSAPVLAQPYATSILVGKSIVLDAGHGGHDPGVTVAQVREADISLSIAQRAAYLLRAEGAHVTLTREEDTYLGLDRRSEMKEGHDLFLSLHSDWRDFDPTLIRPFPVRIMFNPTSDVQSSVRAMDLAGTLTEAEVIESQTIPGQLIAMRNSLVPAYTILFGEMQNQNDLLSLLDPEFVDLLATRLVEGAKVVLRSQDI